MNNLNGIPNFGHGLPEDGIVQAGITDVPQEVPEVETPEEVPAVETETETEEEEPETETETETVESVE